MKRVSANTLCVISAAVMCVIMASYSYSLREKWPGLPPAPKTDAVSYGLGDKQLAYRMIGLMLQNTGDTGGNVTSLKKYDYARVEQWLWKTYALDRRANYVPTLAAFYFGSTPKAEDQAYLIDYLAKIGEGSEGEQWRWLAQAIFIARFKAKNPDKAIDLADRLAAHAGPNVPIWVKQMPGFVRTDVGEKKAARDLMLMVLATDKTLQQADINFSCDYIARRLRETGDNLENNEIWQDFCATLKN